MDPTTFRTLSLLGLGALAVWAFGAVISSRSLKTLLCIRNEAYFTKNGDADWRALLGKFSHVSVKVSNGGDWKSWTRNRAAPLVEAIRASGATPEAWSYVYLSPWRANGWGSFSDGKTYSGYLCDIDGGCPARFRKYRRAYESAEASARAEALAAVAGMRELGLDTLYINGEEAAFARTNASGTRGTGPFSVSNWPDTGSDINSAVRVFADTVKSEIPGAKLIWNGFATGSFTPATVARLDGWLPMRYQISDKGVRKGWASAAAKSFPGLPWGVMTGAKSRYFTGAFFAAFRQYRPTIMAFFYGPGSDLAVTVDAAEALAAAAGTATGDVA